MSGIITNYNRNNVNSLYFPNNYHKSNNGFYNNNGINNINSDNQNNNFKIIVVTEIQVMATILMEIKILVTSVINDNHSNRNGKRYYGQQHE